MTSHHDSIEDLYVIENTIIDNATGKVLHRYFNGAGATPKFYSLASAKGQITSYIKWQRYNEAMDKKFGRQEPATREEKVIRTARIVIGVEVILDD